MNWFHELLNFVREHAQVLALIAGGYIVIELIKHSVKLAAKRFSKTFIDLKTSHSSLHGRQGCNRRTVEGNQTSRTPLFMEEEASVWHHPATHKVCRTPLFMEEPSSHAEGGSYGRRRTPLFMEDSRKPEASWGEAGVSRTPLFMEAETGECERTDEVISRTPLFMEAVLWT